MVRRDVMLAARMSPIPDLWMRREVVAPWEKRQR
jgi:hypothetical protein